MSIYWLFYDVALLRAVRCLMTFLCFLLQRCQQVHAKLFQSCLTLCNPLDCSPAWSNSPGKNIRVGCMPSSRGSSWPRDQTRPYPLCLSPWAGRHKGSKEPLGKAAQVLWLVVVCLSLLYLHRRLKTVTTWELWVMILGDNEGYSLGESCSDSSEELSWRGRV